jgi:dihydrofolate synthase/folylpolyglutamate synthase
LTTSFDEAVAFLDDHINYERMTGVAGKVDGLSLATMRHLVEVLGDPQDTYPVVHLTGTNGKGSTARMITALLAAHDLSVGTYTSPHLEALTERITWDLQPIEPDELARVMGELAALEPLVLEETGGQRPSYFELLTAAAYSWFAQVAVEVAVVEVGMLGRYDATNVATAQVAVVTNVGRDHTSGEGDWRRRIAEEKAGIITAGRPLVLGEADPALVPVFEAEGPDPVWLRDRDFGCEQDKLALGGHLVALVTPNGRYDEVFLPFHGAFQADNAACAVAAVEALFGRALDEDLVRETFARLTLPGRFEVLHRSPLLVLDGAHNPDGAAMAGETLAEEFDVAGRRHWLLGMLGGRDVDAILDGLGVRPGDRVVTCTPDSPRAVPADELATHVEARGVAATAIADPAVALRHIWTAAPDLAGEYDLVMVTGSTYTVGAARTECRRLGLLS